jgi:Abortive infection C-terminus
MIRLYEGHGSKDIHLLGQNILSPQWERLRNIAVRLLERKGNHTPAEFLRDHPFDLYEGTNGFGDEFHLLYLRTPLTSYVEWAERAEDPQVRHQFAIVADAVGEVLGNSYIRFVVVDLDRTEGPESVAQPVLAITSDVVERALRDAEQLIATEGATSGVDRVHTALHGYLRAVAAQASLTVSDDASITQLFKTIRLSHPKLQQIGPRQDDVEKVMRALANVVDAANTIRNQASIAHPNEVLLEEPEAMLVINSIRSLLHYLNARIYT